MAEIDLVPGDYRRTLWIARSLRRFGWLYLSVVLSLLLAKAALAYGVREKNEQLQMLEQAMARERLQQTRLSQLRGEQDTAQKRLLILAGLRGGVAAVEMFRVVERAGDEGLWFLDWKFRRKGELVDKDKETVQRGYFIVLPMEKPDDRERAWLMHTHMEIRARAVDHTTLAGFAKRLIEQPEIDEVRVLNTKTARVGEAEVVDFELAVVVRTEP